MGAPRAKACDRSAFVEFKSDCPYALAAPAPRRRSRNTGSKAAQPAKDAAILMGIVPMNSSRCTTKPLMDFASFGLDFANAQRAGRVIIQ